MKEYKGKYSYREMIGLKRHIAWDFFGCLLGRRLHIEVKDRITLGIISGIIGNMAKNLTSKLLGKTGLRDDHIHAKAAGIFMTKRMAKTESGKGLGILIDFCIACKLGILLVYLLSATGKDHHLLKGASLGQSAWIIMYGVLSSLGASKSHSASAKTSFSNFLAHSIFGMIAAKAIVTLGDPNLFKPRYTSLSNPSEE